MFNAASKAWLDKKDLAYQRMGGLCFGVKDPNTAAVWLPRPQTRETFMKALATTMQYASTAVEAVEDASNHFGIFLIPAYDTDGACIQVDVKDPWGGCVSAVLLSAHLCVKVAVMLGCELRELRMLAVGKQDVIVACCTSKDEGYLFALSSVHNGVALWECCSVVAHMFVPDPTY